VWNRRYSRMLEIWKNNLKGSWILHVFFRQFSEMNLQCRGNTFCGLCKGVFARIGGIPEK
jgi:hypothetical protein